MEALVNLACQNAKNTFRIPGLGKLVMLKRKARIGYNPRTGGHIQIRARRVVKFRLARRARMITVPVHPISGGD